MDSDKSPPDLLIIIGNLQSQGRNGGRRQDGAGREREGRKEGGSKESGTNMGEASGRWEGAMGDREGE